VSAAEAPAHKPSAEPAGEVKRRRNLFVFEAAQEQQPRQRVTAKATHASVWRHTRTRILTGPVG